jgi:ribosomal protein L11 methylase PrmA
VIPARAEGSFRDPSGHVFVAQDRVLRTVNPMALPAFDALWHQGVHRVLEERGLMIETRRLPNADDFGPLAGARGETPACVLQHPRVPFFSYPYEWTFAQLKAAALAHLDLQIAALELGAVLVDATPYNMQPVGGRMQLIDVLSLRPYQDGEMWVGYNQFCRLFLLPLLLEAWSGVPFQPLLRGSLEGMRLTDAVRMLPMRKRWLTINGLMHVTLHAAQEQAHSRARTAALARRPRMLKSRYRALLSELRVWIGSLQSRRPGTYWHDYAVDNSYASDDQRAKEEFVSRFVSKHGIGTLWDLGGNSGDYSQVALRAGARHAVVFDSDLDALDIAWQRQQKHPGLQPVVMDCGDPSPSLGWQQRERSGLLERANADAVLALALTHHLAIGRNIPPRALAHWLVLLAPRGVVEFVPREDPMVQRMLEVREDVFHDYDEQSFLAYLAEVAEVQESQRLKTGGRLLIAWRRHT